MTLLSLALAASLAQATPVVAAPAESGEALKSAQVAPANLPPKPGWSGYANANLSFITGNAQSLTVTFGVGALRTWDKWALGLKGWLAYGSGTPFGGQYAVLALYGGVNIRGDRIINKLISVFAAFTEEFDHLKSIETRSAVDLGVGFNILNWGVKDWEKLYLRIDVGLRGGYETHFQYYPAVERPLTKAQWEQSPYGAAILAQRTGLTFRWSPIKNLRISEELEVIPYLIPTGAATPGRVLVNNTLKVSVQITSFLSLVATYAIYFDSQPPPGLAIPPSLVALNRTPLDQVLTVGVAATF